MADVRPLHAPQPEGATGVVVFADGRTVWGKVFGAEGEAVGELCFNTAMTGYQEVMTDPSYAKQVIAFTFPHIGNVGANDEDVEAAEAHAIGALVREVVTEPSNYRANQGFADWMRKWGRIGIAGVDNNGQSELIDAIAGLRNASSGTITMGGKVFDKATPKEMVDEAGLGRFGVQAFGFEVALHGVDVADGEADGGHIGLAVAELRRHDLDPLMSINREDHLFAVVLLVVAHGGAVEVLGGGDVVCVDAHEGDAGDGGALLGDQRGGGQSCGCEKSGESHARKCSGFDSQGQKMEFEKI